LTSIIRSHSSTLQPIEGRERHHAGIVDEHVDSPVGLDGRLHQLAHVLPLRHVRDHRSGLAARFGDLGRQCFDPVGAARPEDDAGASCGEIACGRGAHAARCAGDDDYLTRDVVSHLRFSIAWALHQVPG
jgi:hypothetical protein